MGIHVKNPKYKKKVTGDTLVLKDFKDPSIIPLFIKSFKFY